ncbi:MAG: hypothetical protein ABL957_02620 [Parvularculaceae bacterium]
MHEVVFDPIIPLWALGVAGVVSLAMCWLGFFIGSRGAFLRLLAVATLLALLANPILRTAETTPLDDIAVIVEDKSGSQTLDGRADASGKAANELEMRLKSLERVEVRRREATGEEETRLVEAIEAAVADAPRGRLGGVFVITDGQAADAQRGETFSLDAPVHFLFSGRESEIDRKITLINAPRYGIVRSAVKISFRIDDLGPNEKPVARGEHAVVSLRVDGKEQLREAVPIGAEVAFNAPLDRPGSLVLELEVGERAEELTIRNNTVVLPITAIRDRLRVLLISGEPHPGERVWRNLLKSDPAVDLVHFTILRPIEKGSPFERTEELSLIPFPQDELFIEKLGEFDLVIFDRYAYRGVLDAYHFDNIARYVENGGAVLVATGPEYFGPDSLALQRNISFILPATPAAQAIDGAFRPRLSADGLRHPVTADLPDQAIWGRWLRILPVTPRSGQTLMEGPDRAPLLILDRVGEGRVGLLVSDHVWLWARGFDGGGPHTELLRRIAHWLMKEPELEEEQLSLLGVGGALVIRRRSMSPAPGVVEITAPDGAVREIALAERKPGFFEATIETASRGIYRARSDNLFAVGAVGLAAAPEFENVVSNLALLAPVADKTRGGSFSFRRGDAIALPAVRRVEPGGASYSGSGWAGLVSRHAFRTDRVADAALGGPYFWLAVIAVLFGLAWWIEGRTPRRRDAPSDKV